MTFLSMPLLQWGQICLLIYAGLLLVGGLMGFAKAKSKISLMAGVAGAGLAGLSWWLSQTNASLGFGLGIGLAALLLVVFLVRLQKTAKFMPAGLMSIVSLSTVVIMSGILLKMS